MFVPCEGLGVAVAAIAAGCGAYPVRMEFRDDCAVVEFVPASGASSRRAGASAPRGASCVPDGPWERVAPGKVRGKDVRYRCGTVEMSTVELAEATGIKASVVYSRLRSDGYLYRDRGHGGRLVAAGAGAGAPAQKTAEAAGAAEA